MGAAKAFDKGGIGGKGQNAVHIRPVSKQGEDFVAIAIRHRLEEFRDLRDPGSLLRHGWWLRGELEGLLDEECFLVRRGQRLAPELFRHGNLRSLLGRERHGFRFERRGCLLRFAGGRCDKQENDEESSHAPFLPDCRQRDNPV